MFRFFSLCIQQPAGKGKPAHANSLFIKQIHLAVKNTFGQIMVCLSGPPHDPALALVKATV